MSSATPLTYRLARSLLFRLEPERAHRLGMLALRLAAGLRLSGPPATPRLERRIGDLTFSCPIGLAAGFDKNAEAVKSFVFMGLGFAEVGTVTPLPQPGNPRPRLFRYPRERCLQNALGFNNHGMAALSARLEGGRRRSVPLGVNIGKNKATPDAAAEDDYAILVERLADRCDFFVINVSSPNTPGLRDLQEAGRLRGLVERLGRLTTLPVMIKLAPDLGAGEAATLSAAAIEGGAAGVVVCNTTTDYSLLPGARDFGGISGAVLRERSYEMLREVVAALGSESTVVSVGGIDSGAEVYRRLTGGADLVEIYSALVFEGPGLVRRMRRELVELMDRDGVRDVREIAEASR